MVLYNMINISSDNGLLVDSTKSSPEPMHSQDFNLISARTHTNTHTHTHTHAHILVKVTPVTSPQSCCFLHTVLCNGYVMFGLDIGLILALGHGKMVVNTAFTHVCAQYIWHTHRTQEHAGRLCGQYIEGILPKGPYLSCVSMGTHSTQEGCVLNIYIIHILPRHTFSSWCNRISWQ